jgi:hypothetical protein
MGFSVYKFTLPYALVVNLLQRVEFFMFLIYLSAEIRQLSVILQINGFETMNVYKYRNLQGRAVDFPTRQSRCFCLFF